MCVHFVAPFVPLSSRLREETFVIIEIEEVPWNNIVGIISRKAKSGARAVNLGIRLCGLKTMVARHF